MCQSRWFITIGIVCGLIQSILWMGFGITAALTYLCVLPVPPYKDKSDFFRVTLVKFYFEGPKCIPDGSYLGKFNEEYRKISLFTPDLVFSVMISYVILNAVYFILSFRLYSDRNKQNIRGLTLSWSGLTLILCAIDVFLTYKLILDVFTLKKHMVDSEEELGSVVVSSAKSLISEVPYISLALALVSIRFVAIWLWNFIVGFSLFLDALCFKNIIQIKNKKQKEEKALKVVGESLKPKHENLQNSNKLINGESKTTFDIRNHSDYLDYKNSMEGITRFSNVPENSSSHKESINRNWRYDPSEGYWRHSKPQTSKEWEYVNEGYINEEPISGEPERQFDFDHDLKNFESGHRKIKVVRHPVGKPVSIPVPPPLPISGSNC